MESEVLTVTGTRCQKVVKLYYLFNLQFSGKLLVKLFFRKLVHLN